MTSPQLIRILVVWLASLGALGSGVVRGQIRLPQIDPSGNRFFLPSPNSTTILNPFHANTTGSGGLFSHARNSATNAQAFPTNKSYWLGSHTKSGNATPAFTHPAAIPACANPNDPNCGRKSAKYLIPDAHLFKAKGNAGQIILTPSRIIAPVGSEVVALAGICGGDGTFVLNQPLEWMLSNDSVGQIIEVGGGEHPNFNRTVPPTSQKFDGQYAVGRTGLKEKVVTRGTPTPCDDIEILKGQTYISLSSASPGTTYLTAVAPKATGWDRRRATTVIHWVDGIWSIPTPIKTTSGTVQPMTTTVSRVTDGSGIPDWKVRYTIVDGAPAEFVPTGSQQAEVATNTDGQATVQVRQQAGKVEPGTTSVRVDVIRPSMFGEQDLVVESGVTTITWSAPAITIVAKGPESAPLDLPYNYRIEVSNPGDQTARGVVVKSNSFGDDVKFISSSPKPAVYGKTLQWDLGDIAPGTVPRIIDVQMKADTRGMKRTCFEVASEADQLKTEACVETEVAVPCIGLKIDGPTSSSVGQQATFNIEVFNQCDDAIEDVRINVAYDIGISAPEIGNPMSMNIGRLEFGEKRSIPLVFDVTQSGIQCFTMNVTSRAGHTAAARRCLEVSQAVVGTASIVVDGDRLVTVNDRLLAKARIINTGNVPLDGVSVINKFSSSLQPTQATAGIQSAFVGNDLLFQVGRIAPGQEVIIDVEYSATEADGNAFSQFTVVEPIQIENRLPIRIEPRGGFSNQPQTPRAGDDGIQIPADPTGALTVDVKTDSRPFPADSATTSRISFDVRNQSQRPMQNVVITMLVPPGTDIINFDSSQAELNIASISQDKRVVTMEARQLLRAGEVLHFEADLVGNSPGQVTFEVDATSNDVIGVQRGRGVVNFVPR